MKKVLIVIGSIAAAVMLILAIVFYATSGADDSAEGVLHLEGYFPTTPSRAYFSYTYLHRHGRWQLLGIDFKVKPVEQ